MGFIGRRYSATCPESGRAMGADDRESTVAGGSSVLAPKPRLCSEQTQFKFFPTL